MEAREFDRLLTKISALDVEDLEKIGTHIQATIVSKKSAAREALEQDVRQRIADSGFDPDEFLGAHKANGQKIAAKYRNPENPEQTWGGRGKRPNWMSNALASGKNLNDMLIPGGGGGAGGVGNEKTTDDTKAA